MKAVVYCDGSGGATAGPGGVGFVATVDGVTYEGSLPLDRATNQMAELLAAAYVLDQIEPCELVQVVSDSEYVVKGISEWLPAWERRGWRTASGRPVKNVSHWRRLLVAAARHERVEFQWTRGHAGNEGNERADQLAGEARERALNAALAAGTA